MVHSLTIAIIFFTYVFSEVMSHSTNPSNLWKYQQSKGPKQGELGNIDKFNSPGLGPERVRSLAFGKVHLFSTLSVSTLALVFNSQQFSATHSFFCNKSAIQSVLHTNFEPSPLFSAKISSNASTAARTTVSCLYSAHARLPLREPPGLLIEFCLTLAEHLF